MPQTPDQPMQGTSLDLLHDLSMPQEFGWWPPAPGWYVVILVIITAIAIWLFQAFARYRAGAYRRAALRELESLHDQASIAELLRRTALVVTPRSVIADLTGGQWLEWLESCSSSPMPDSVKAQLIQGVYQQTDQRDDLQQLKLYAAYWISSHRTSLKQP